MKVKPVNGQRVRCDVNTEMRIPVPIGAIGTCTGDMWNHPEMVWVHFDGQPEDQSMNWNTELGLPFDVPDGYALISIDVLKAWGKYDEVVAACFYPIDPTDTEGGSHD